MADDPVVGIDLGTTNSCVAWWDVERGAAVPLHAQEEPPTLPSCVAFTPDGAVVGEEACAVARTCPSTAVHNAKRVLGRSLEEARAVEGKRVRQDVHGELVYTLTTEKGGTLHVPAVRVSALLLQALKQRAEAALRCSVRRAIITVPAHFTSTQREATRRAAEEAGLTVLKLLAEPTAAAMAYGLLQLGKKRVLVFDLGGGTLDVSVLRVTDKHAEVCAIGGSTDIGGEAFTSLLCDTVGAALAPQEWQRIRNSAVLRTRWRDAVETAKVALSAGSEAVVELHAPAQRVSVRHTLSRAQLERCIAPLVRRSMEVVANTLHDAGVAAREVDEVVLVGGATRTPYVRAELQRAVPVPALCCALDADLAVAQGAAVEAAVVAGYGDRVAALLMTDVSPCALGFALADGSMQVAIPRLARLPASGRVPVTAARAGQPAVTVDVYEGDHALVAHNRRLGSFNFPLPPGATPGTPAMEVELTANESGLVCVQALPFPGTEAGAASASRTTGARGWLARNGSLLLLSLYVVILCALYLWLKLALFPRRALDGEPADDALAPDDMLRDDREEL